MPKLKSLELPNSSRFSSSCQKPNWWKKCTGWCEIVRCLYLYWIFHWLYSEFLFFFLSKSHFPSLKANCGCRPSHLSTTQYSNQFKNSAYKKISESYENCTFFQNLEHSNSSKNPLNIFKQKNYISFLKFRNKTCVFNEILD